MKWPRRGRPGQERAFGWGKRSAAGTGYSLWEAQVHSSFLTHLSSTVAWSKRGAGISLSFLCLPWTALLIAIGLLAWEGGTQCEWKWQQRAKRKGTVNWLPPEREGSSPLTLLGLTLYSAMDKPLPQGLLAAPAGGLETLRNPASAQQMEGTQHRINLSDHKNHPWQMKCAKRNPDPGTKQRAFCCPFPYIETSTKFTSVNFTVFCKGSNNTAMGDIRPTSQPLGRNASVFTEVAQLILLRDLGLCLALGQQTKSKTKLKRILTIPNRPQGKF